MNSFRVLFRVLSWFPSLSFGEGRGEVFFGEGRGEVFLYLTTTFFPLRM